MLHSNYKEINQLINYYQALVKINHQFTDISILDNATIHYENLVEQLIIIRRLLINKTITNINAVYKPTERLFLNKEHFKVLEATVQFYKQNADVVYPMPELEEPIMIDNNKTDTAEVLESHISVITELQQAITVIKNHIATEYNSSLSQAVENMCMQLSSIEEKLTILSNNGDLLEHKTVDGLVNTEMLGNLSEMRESINRLIDGDSGQAIIKSTNDAIAVLHTNYKLMETDIKKYDSLLTDHINQTSTNITLAIEKEHSRFVQRMSSEVNAIIAGISSAASNEFSIQTDLIKDSMQKLDDQSFKRSCVVFVGVVSAVFACSFLSSAWTVNKVVGNNKLFRIEVTHKSTTPVNSRKTNTH